jgi:hypothetical protein
VFAFLCLIVCIPVVCGAMFVDAHELRKKKMMKKMFFLLADGRMELEWIEEKQKDFER